MTRDIKKSQVETTDKSAKFLYIITVFAASVIDWHALQVLWNAATGGKLTSQVPFITGATQDEQAGHVIECKGGTVVPIVNPGEAPTDGKGQISGIVEGVNEDTLAWAYELQGEEVVAIVERCSDGKKFIFANPCTGGMIFQYQSIGAQDGGNSGISFQLTGADCPKPMLVYAPA